MSVTKYQTWTNRQIGKRTDADTDDADADTDAGRMQGQSPIAAGCSRLQLRTGGSARGAVGVKEGKRERREEKDEKGNWADLHGRVRVRVIFRAIFPVVLRSFVLSFLVLPVVRRRLVTEIR